MGKLLQKEEAGLLRKPAGKFWRPNPLPPSGPLSGRRPMKTPCWKLNWGPAVHGERGSFHSEKREVLGHIATISDISEVRRLALEKSRFIAP